MEIPKDKDSKQHKGFGFVEFEEEEDAAHAMDNMHESLVFGKVIKVQKARKDYGAKHKAVWEDKDYDQKYGTVDERLKARQETTRDGQLGQIPSNDIGAMEALEKEAMIQETVEELKRRRDASGGNF